MKNSCNKISKRGIINLSLKFKPKGLRAIMRCAEAMVKCLESEHITTVFGLPGATICPFYDALYHSNIRHILVRHEQNAGHAASGYARMTGKPAVCIATSGPGALNLITAIATAYMDSIPLIVITGQVPSEQLGRDVFQEADITGSAEPFVKHSYLVKQAQDIPRIFKEAFHIASTGRQGPVLIDIPVDIQSEDIVFSYPETIQIRSYSPNTNGHMGQIKKVIAALKKAKRPLLCAGGGIFSSNAQAVLLKLSQKAKIPIVTTMMGLSAVSPNYELYFGMIGMYGSRFANQAMNEADLIILIGARVGDRAIMSPMGLSEHTTIVHIDIDPAEVGKNMETHIPLVGDANNILSILLTLVEEQAVAWKQRSALSIPTKQSDMISPCCLLHELMRQAKKDACIVADVGQNQIWSARAYAVEQGRFLTSGGMGTMGYSLPCAIGAYLAEPQRQVIAICGDGAFQMAMAELATISANDLNIKLLILNNQSLGLVKELQDKQYQGHEFAVSLNGNPNFAALASAYGIQAKRITSSAEISSAITEFLSTEKSYILECIISKEAKTIESLS